MKGTGVLRAHEQSQRYTASQFSLLLFVGNMFSNTVTKSDYRRSLNKDPSFSTEKIEKRCIFFTKLNMSFNSVGCPQRGEVIN